MSLQFLFLPDEMQRAGKTPINFEARRLPGNAFDQCVHFGRNLAGFVQRQQIDDLDSAQRRFDIYRNFRVRQQWRDSLLALGKLSRRDMLLGKVGLS